MHECTCVDIAHSVPAGPIAMSKIAILNLDCGLGATISDPGCCWYQANPCGYSPLDSAVKDERACELREVEYGKGRHHPDQSVPLPSQLVHQAGTLPSNLCSGSSAAFATRYGTVRRLGAWMVKV